MRKLLSVLACTVLAAFSLSSCSSGPKIAKGYIVKVDYVGTLANGDTFDSTKERTPFAFLVGANQVLPAFEEKMIGLRKGAKKKFTLSADKAYGTHDATKVAKLPRDERFPADLDIQVGKVIFANRPGPDGKLARFPVKVVEANEKEIAIDYNHPLAGQALTYEVEIVDIIAPDQQEPKTGAAGGLEVKKVPAKDSAAVLKKVQEQKAAQEQK